MKKINLIAGIAMTLAIAFSCSKSDDPDPQQVETPGPKFLAVKSIITSSCALSGCHVSPTNTGGINFGTNANIVANASRIKTQAVDLGTMPPTGPLSAADKAKISDWVSAGGRLTD